MNQPSISQYLVSTCLLIIDEFNELFRDVDKETLKNKADKVFNEMDITVMLGYPFRHSVHYNAINPRSKTKKVHDLWVDVKDFSIEVKYLKNWKSSLGHDSNKKNWDEYEKDFSWLFNEIDEGNKDKRAFIIGWFNCVDYFASLIKLGSSRGSKPVAEPGRVRYFPFLYQDTATPIASDLVINYNLAYKPMPVSVFGRMNGDYQCIFLGQKEDVFHFALYY